ncbi:hypothetical protein DYB26_015984 [Aphanomyces astaci]|uniref:Uncharacterized protein n=1 Tax=Aphanomyces astaci TaxID=112090 RepID=A0A397EIS1_APHAT|nr:hypothetical protein DYB34_005825 [Aphanomyces astaci]RHY93151.1 hypothetical protein DYB31_016338 [Aphanomyces astaci]RHY96379.1 hypothetical protein DYB26_015984 [Aphanomyces astaci]
MVRIQFSINPSLQHPDNLLSIVNYRKEIETICEERFGFTFHGDLNEHGQQLLGTPIQRTAHAWAAPQRGYLFLRDISVVKLYQYAGVLSNGLYYHQLEYCNRSKLAPADLLPHAAGKNRLDQVPPSMKLYPLRDLSWDNPSSTFFHPLSPSAAALVDTKVHMGPLPTLTTPEDILAALHGSQLPTPDVDIIDNYATTFDSPSGCLPIECLRPTWEHSTLRTQYSRPATRTHGPPTYHCDSGANAPTVSA